MSDPTPSPLPTRPFACWQVLDAPALQDDFYLNLVDWSSQNVLAVGLGTCVYLWSAYTSKVRPASVWVCRFRGLVRVNVASDCREIDVASLFTCDVVDIRRSPSCATLDRTTRSRRCDGLRAGRTWRSVPTAATCKFGMRSSAARPGPCSATRRALGPWRGIRRTCSPRARATASFSTATFATRPTLWLSSRATSRR